MFLSFGGTGPISNERSLKVHALRFRVPFARSCLVYVGFVQPGQNAADIVCPWRGRNATISVQRNGQVQDPNEASAATRKGPSSTRVDVNTTGVGADTTRHDVDSTLPDVGAIRPDVGTTRLDAGTPRLDVGTTRLDVDTTRLDGDTTRLDIDRRDITLGKDRREWEHTSVGCGYSPNPDIVFKCVDAGLAAVVGAAVERREQRLGDAVPAFPAPIGVSHKPRNESTEDDGLQLQPPSTPRDDNRKEDDLQLQPVQSFVSCAHQEDDGWAGLQSERFVDGIDRTQRAATTCSKAKTAGMQCASEGTRRGTSAKKNDNIPEDTIISSGASEANGDNLQMPHSDSRRDTQQQQQPQQTHTDAKNLSRKPGVAAALDPVSRPQVCVPLTGVGDSGCIGMVGVQGFATGAVVNDEDWRDWFAARMVPLRKGEHRAVKRIKLVRPRVLPAQGRLENVPSGTAARVVYGSVERISSKRGRPMYTVR